MGETMKTKWKFSFSFFGGPCLRHVEVPRPGIEPMPQQGSEPLQWQCLILNLPGHQGTLKLPFHKRHLHVQGKPPLFPTRHQKRGMHDFLDTLIAREGKDLNLHNHLTFVSCALPGHLP